MRWCTVFTEKNLHIKWICAVHTHIVQGSPVLRVLTTINVIFLKFIQLIYIQIMFLNLNQWHNFTSSLISYLSQALSDWVTKEKCVKLLIVMILLRIPKIYLQETSITTVMKMLMPLTNITCSIQCSLKSFFKLRKARTVWRIREVYFTHHY